MAQTFQNFNKVDPTLSLVKDTFQITDCNGNNVGDLQDILKTVVINQQSVKDCNSDAILTALQAIQASEAIDVEFMVTQAQEACVDNAGSTSKAFVRTKFIFNSETGTFTSEVVEYSLDGISGWSTTAPVGTITLGACSVAPPSVANQVVANNYVPFDATGNPLGGPVTETKIYDSAGALVSTTYTDSVTGAATTLPAGTVFLTPYVNTTVTSEILCDDNGSFLRVFYFSTSGQLTTTQDYTLAGAAYTVVGTVSKCENTPVEYNNIDIFPLSDANTHIVAADTTHSVSIAVLSGSATITINGKSFVAPEGYSNTWEATTLLDKSITVTTTLSTDLVIIDTIS